jgi:hypothetical protein
MPCSAVCGGVDGMREARTDGSAAEPPRLFFALMVLGALRYAVYAGLPRYDLGILLASSASVSPFYIPMPACCAFELCGYTACLLLHINYLQHAPTRLVTAAPAIIAALLSAPLYQNTSSLFVG